MDITQSRRDWEEEQQKQAEAKTARKAKRGWIYEGVAGTLGGYKRTAPSAEKVGEGVEDFYRWLGRGAVKSVASQLDPTSMMGITPSLLKAVPAIAQHRAQQKAAGKKPDLLTEAQIVTGSAPIMAPLGHFGGALAVGGTVPKLAVAQWASGEPIDLSFASVSDELKRTLDPETYGAPKGDMIRVMHEMVHPGRDASEVGPLARIAAGSLGVVADLALDPVNWALGGLDLYKAGTNATSAARVSASIGAPRATARAVATGAVEHPIWSGGMRQLMETLTEKTGPEAADVFFGDIETSVNGAVNRAMKDQTLDADAILTGHMGQTEQLRSVIRNAVRNTLESKYAPAIERIAADDATGAAMHGFEAGLTELYGTSIQQALAAKNVRTRPVVRLTGENKGIRMETTPIWRGVDTTRPIRTTETMAFEDVLRREALAARARGEAETLNAPDSPTTFREVGDQIRDANVAKYEGQMAGRANVIEVVEDEVARRRVTEDVRARAAEPVSTEEPVGPSPQEVMRDRLGAAARAVVDRRGTTNGIAPLDEVFKEAGLHRRGARAQAEWQEALDTLAAIDRGEIESSWVAKTGSTTSHNQAGPTGRFRNFYTEVHPGQAPRRYDIADLNQSNAHSFTPREPSPPVVDVPVTAQPARLPSVAPRNSRTFLGAMEQMMHRTIEHPIIRQAARELSDWATNEAPDQSIHYLNRLAADQKGRLVDDVARLIEDGTYDRSLMPQIVHPVPTDPHGAYMELHPLPVTGELVFVPDDVAANPAANADYLNAAQDYVDAVRGGNPEVVRAAEQTIRDMDRPRPQIRTPGDTNYEPRPTRLDPAIRDKALRETVGEQRAIIRGKRQVIGRAIKELRASGVAAASDEIRALRRLAGPVFKPAKTIKQLTRDEMLAEIASNRERIATFRDTPHPTDPLYTPTTIEDAERLTATLDTGDLLGALKRLRDAHADDARAIRRLKLGDIPTLLADASTRDVIESVARDASRAKRAADIGGARDLIEMGFNRFAHLPERLQVAGRQAINAAENIASKFETYMAGLLNHRSTADRVHLMRAGAYQEASVLKKVGALEAGETIGTTEAEVLRMLIENIEGVGAADIAGAVLSDGTVDIAKLPAKHAELLQAMRDMNRIYKWAYDQVAPRWNKMVAERNAAAGDEILRRFNKLSEGPSGYYSPQMAAIGGSLPDLLAEILANHISESTGRSVKPQMFAADFRSAFHKEAHTAVRATIEHPPVPGATEGAGVASEAARAAMEEAISFISDPTHIVDLYSNLIRNRRVITEMYEWAMEWGVDTTKMTPKQIERYMRVGYDFPRVRGAVDQGIPRLLSPEQLAAYDTAITGFGQIPFWSQMLRWLNRFNAPVVSGVLMTTSFMAAQVAEMVRDMAVSGAHTVLTPRLAAKSAREAIRMMAYDTIMDAGVVTPRTFGEKVRLRWAIAAEDALKGMGRPDIEARTMAALNSGLFETTAHRISEDVLHSFGVRKFGNNRVLINTLSTIIQAPDKFKRMMIYADSLERGMTHEQAMLRVADNTANYDVGHDAAAYGFLRAIQPFFRWIAQRPAQMVKSAMRKPLYAKVGLEWFKDRRRKAGFDVDMSRIIRDGAPEETKKREDYLPVPFGNMLMAPMRPRPGGAIETIDGPYVAWVRNRWPELDVLNTMHQFAADPGKQIGQSSWLNFYYGFFKDWRRMPGVKSVFNIAETPPGQRLQKLPIIGGLMPRATPADIVDAGNAPKADPSKPWEIGAQLPSGLLTGFTNRDGSLQFTPKMMKLARAYDPQMYAMDRQKAAEKLQRDYMMEKTEFIGRLKVPETFGVSVRVDTLRSMLERMSLDELNGLRTTVDQMLNEGRDPVVSLDELDELIKSKQTSADTKAFKEGVVKPGVAPMERFKPRSSSRSRGRSRGRR